MSNQTASKSDFSKNLRNGFMTESNLFSAKENKRLHLMTYCQFIGTKKCYDPKK